VAIYCMRRFSEFLQYKENIREIIVQTTNRIYNLDPKDVEDTKDVLLELKKVLEDKLAGY
jgi:hypothetical protein